MEFVSSCCLRERFKKKKNLTLAAYFLHLETLGLPAYYPLNMLPEQLRCLSKAPHLD